VTRNAPTLTADRRSGLPAPNGSTETGLVAGLYPQRAPLSPGRFAMIRARGPALLKGHLSTLA
jgi:hypothetical protein